MATPGASVEVRVGVDYWHVIIYTDLEGDSWEERPLSEHFARVEKCEVAPAAVDEFGAIGEGELIVMCLVREGVLAGNVEMQGGVERMVHHVVINDVKLPIHSDYLLDEPGVN